MQELAVTMVRKRARGWARLSMLALGTAGAGFGSAYGLADFRIEQSADGAVCGVARNFLGSGSGRILVRLPTHEEACRTLFQQSAAACPVLGPSAWAGCESYRPAAHVERIRITRVVAGKPPPSVDLAPTWIEKLFRSAEPQIAGPGLQEATAEDFPTLVRIRRSKPYASCLGAVVGPKALLTASHCVEGGAVTLDWTCGTATSSLSMNCSPVSLDYPGASCRHTLTAGCEKEVHVCVAAHPLQCSGFTAENILATAQPKHLEVLGEQSPGFARGTAQCVSWPRFDEPDIGERFVRFTSPRIQAGDSGAPAFDSPASGVRSVVAVNSEHSPTRLVALWNLERDLDRWATAEKVALCGVASGPVPPAGACRR